MATVADATESSPHPESVNDIADSLQSVSLLDRDQEEAFITEQLESLECPFTWKISNHRDTHEWVIDRTKGKLEEIEEEGAFQWRTFTLTLVLCYEYFCMGDRSQSLEKQRELERLLTSRESKGIYEKFFQATKDALFHVALACKCHLLLKEGILNETKQTFLKIRKCDDMSNPCKSAMWGIRAAVAMEYGYEGNELAVEWVEKALELDEEQGEWHFLLGKALGRIRRVKNYTEIPKVQELKALEKAVQLTRNPSYIIFLAQSYREAAFRAFSMNRYDVEKLNTLKARLEDMNKRSAQLYREALEMKRECSHINIRCAQGFLKLPHPFKDVKLAKELCDRSLALAPNNAMANHVAGGLYERFEGDIAKAMELYDIAGKEGAYGAYMDLFKLKYSKDPEGYNPIPDFEDLLKRYTEKPRVEETVAQMGSYFFFIKDDLVTAYSKYWKQLITDNPDSEKLKNHKCIFVRMMRLPVNIYELIFDEARLALKNRTANLDEDKRMFRQIILHISDKFPDMLKSSPKPRRKIILDEAANVNYNRSRSHRGRGRGRRGQRGRSRGYEGAGRGERESRDGGYNRSQSREGGRGFHHRGNYNRSQSRERGRGGRRGGHSRGLSRDSSTESRGSYQGERFRRTSSRDSSADSRNGHESRERYYDSSWRKNRDSSNESRSSKDRNWRSGPRKDFSQMEQNKFTHRRDSSSSSVDSKSDNGPRTESTGSRRRTESASSIGSDTRRDWRDGCSGGGRSREAGSNWRANTGTSDRPTESQRYSSNKRGTGMRTSRGHQNKEAHDSAGSGDDTKTRRGGYRVKEGNFRMSWRNTNKD